MYEPMYHGYSQSRSSGRLPSLQSIGKSKTVDEDEPPDVPLAVYGYDLEAHDHSFSSVESVFEVSDAEDACKLLRKAFHMLGPGRHACKRNPDHGGSHFVHCRRGVKLGGHYCQIRRLLEERALVELLRDCIYRVRSAQLFVEELEGLLNAEYRTAYAIQHGCLLEAPVSKLYCLNALCEDLRVHAGHWNSIKHRTNTNRWLQPILGFLCQELRAVQRTLVTLCDRAIFIVDRMVHVGFEVLAHCDLDSLTPDILWNITRGLEDFNNIVATYRMLSAAEGVYPGYSLPHNSKLNHASSPTLLGTPSPQSYFCLYLHPALANAPGRLSESIKSIPFPKVLGILANERSRYAAQLTHRFFTANEAFTLALRATPHLPSFEWEEDLVSTVSGVHLTSRALSVDVGDFHSSHASLNAALLQIGSLRVPDLSSLPSPLVEFSQKEQHFADSFLQIVCTSTSLLRKNDNSSSRAKSKQKTDFKVPLSPVVGRPPRVQGDTPVLSRSDSRRKTVSWGDNADSSIRTQVVAMYMNVLWQHFGRNLDLFLDEPAWAGKVGLLQSEVGSIFMQGDTVNAMLRHMMEHICMKDMFPPGSVSPLLGVVVRLHALSAFAAWDNYMTSAGSSQTDDKCYPSLMSEGQYSTRSGRLLRDAHRPLLALLHEVCRNMGQLHSESVELIPPYDLDLSLVSGISARLLTTCQASCTWCSNKLHHFLSTGNVQSFLFLAYTDLRILSDYSQRASSLLQMLTTNPPAPPSSLLDQLALTQLCEAQQHASAVSTQTKKLESSCLGHFTDKFSEQAASFFQDHLPPVKCWRRKVPPEFPEDASSYVQQMWDYLLYPVTEGVAKLPGDSQLAVLTATINALCGAWTTAFLKEKTKFSLYGAQQLGVDFDTLRARLNDGLYSVDVRRGVLDLPIFRQLSGIAQLLKKQPQRRPTSRFRDCSTEDLSCQSADRHPSPSASRTELPANMEESQDVNDISFVPNTDEWLALRVIGGTRSWRFPSCFGANSGQR